jgi:hypothetical protein
MDTQAMHNVLVKISFDDEAQVWWVEESSLHGLRLEDTSLDALMARIPLAIGDLIDATADLDGDLAQPMAPLDVVMNIHRAMSAMPHAA